MYTNVMSRQQKIIYHKYLHQKRGLAYISKYSQLVRYTNSNSITIITLLHYCTVLQYHITRSTDKIKYIDVWLIR